MVEKNNPVKVSVSSGKGGVGKTTITVNLALALSQKGLRTLVVDGDMGLANVDVLLNLDPVASVRDLLNGEGDPLEAVIFLTSHFAVLPASSGVARMAALGPGEHERLGALLDDVGRHFDCLFLDTAAGIGPSVLWFNTFAQHNVIVVSPDPTSLTDAYALMKILSKDHGCDRFSIVMNFLGSKEEGLQIFENLARVAARFLQVNPVHLGSVLHDKAVTRSVRSQQLLLKQSPGSAAGLALRAIADRLEKRVKVRG